MISVFEHPWLSGLFGDDAISALWSAESQIAHYIAFEAALARALAATDKSAVEAARRAALAIEAARIDLSALKEGTAKDGLPIPAFVRALKAEAGEDAEFVHKGATSQDVIDTALALTIAKVVALLAPRIRALDERLLTIADEFGERRLMGRTRMQAALKMTVADRVAAWRAPLAGQLDELTRLAPRLQLGGAVGDNRVLGDAAAAVTEHMATSLGLSAPSKVWHTDRSSVAEFANRLSILTGVLGKIGQDIALMSQQGIDEVSLKIGGGSSAMPHKSNPVLAELLVTLARFNSGQLSLVHSALIHEQERSGAAWALEWMTLPTMTVVAGRSLTSAIELLRQVHMIGQIEKTPK